MTDIDVVIHVDGNYKNVTKLILNLFNQQKITLNKIVIALTSKNTHEEERFKEFCKSKKVFLFEIESWYYSSSLTIQRAIRHYCTSPIVVVIHQNISIARTDTLYNLVKDIEKNKCSFTFGRQIVKHQRLEKYMFNEIYPPMPYFINKGEFSNIQFETFFTFGSFIALNRDLFIKLGGYDEVDHPLCGNLVYLKKILDNNYSVKYESTAIAHNPYHQSAHQTKVKYYLIRRFMLDTPSLNEYDESVINKPFLSTVAKTAFKRFDIIGLFRLIAYTFSKSRGLSKAKK